jgi:hypothetical protein
LSSPAIDYNSQIRGSLMRNDRKINVSFAASAEDYIRRFTKVAEEAMPNSSLVPIFTWHISGKFTNKATGEVTNYAPGVGFGAIEPEKLANELIVPMGGLKVAIRLPEELQSANRLKIDFADGSVCRRRQLMSKLRPVLPRRRLPGRIPDMFDGHKRIDP